MSTLSYKPLRSCIFQTSRKTSTVQCFPLLATHHDSFRFQRPIKHNDKWRNVRANTAAWLGDIAAALDEPLPPWTLDQIAGLVFAGLLIAFYFSAKEIDTLVARNQRKQLGLCEHCGGLYEPSSCPHAKCPERTNTSTS